MPFYIRKSVKAGPFRFNFSKGGVGVSVGVKGLRVGTGPRGHYIHAGRGGLYYRASIGTTGKRHLREKIGAIPAQLTFEESAVNMVEIESGDVMEMRDENFAELLDEINAKASQWRLSVLFGGAFALLGFFLLFQTQQIGIWILVAALLAWALGAWLDSYRRSTVLFYDIDGPVEQAYKDTIAAFDGLSECAAKWHIEAGGAINDLTTWKRNAGASYLVKRKPTKLAYALPSVIKSNITPPSVHVGKQIIYFLPDVALISHNARFGAVSYSDLRIRTQQSRFIEEGHLPRDAKVVDHTWQHPNKSGGPDRRFRNNRRLPICLYDTLHLRSDSGLNEVLEFSQIGKLSDFAAGCLALAKAKAEAVQAPKAIQSPESSLSVQSLPISVTPTATRPKNSVATITGIIGCVVGVIIAIAIFQNSGRSPAQSTSLVGAGTGSTQLPSTTTPASVTSPPIPTQTAKLLPLSSQPDQEPIPDSTAYEPLVAALTKPDTSSVKSSPEPPPIVPFATQQQPKIAYIKQPIQLRDGPGPKYIPVGSVGQNALITILETENGWVHVFGGPSVSGWLPKELLGQNPVSRQATAPKMQNTFEPTSRPHDR